ncbi:hypothetical protein DMR_35970 [Solidesulfovibrio magneticus RS-1]|uniref:Uncharacterized protein n=1 Tax=Solidesulfovibrio magneticus (strain ATCC 700980 / DSM 13731 / RS-1) TaxID=573370 RepID=C4XLE9_SOLM1|nr:hypothetical protein DMR_35970 [Solidesulfovibrio magneticus RS-1]
MRKASCPYCIYGATQKQKRFFPRPHDPDRPLGRRQYFRSKTV